MHPAPLRLATPADIPSVVALECDVPGLVHWSEQTYQTVFQPGAQERHLWVIADGGQLQAFLVARFGAAECELENLVVANQHRRRGLASQLLQVLVAIARQRKMDRVLLEVRESNQAARALYEKVGFQENARRKAYYSQPPEDAILLSLSLNCTSADAPNR
ncbi:MAG: ribosomal protein S18-alanine N-acetyltransferase [Terriglobales bacterium]